MVKTHQFRKLAVKCVERVSVTEPSRLFQANGWDELYSLERKYEISIDCIQSLLCSEAPHPKIDVLTEEDQRKRDQDETLCRGYILRKNNKGNNKKRKGTWNYSKDNKKDYKPLSEVVCYKCGDKGHIKCYLEQVDTTEIIAMISEMNIGMIQELHMASVTTRTDDWWYDSGATTHVCNNKDLFKTYRETEDGPWKRGDPIHIWKEVNPYECPSCS
ncbi:hypothetical protein Tco_1112106 [Tanacetum coccineum]|uniref:Retrovirus-related Pol polyprotein from transposon TNT 1-94-like beta-barrel domain-containing protein n=1 Tax=Tanacetum coccineum TaxID=301880 RepID=A0ABQ5IR69_9ASTR